MVPSFNQDWMYGQRDTAAYSWTGEFQNGFTTFIILTLWPLIAEGRNHKRRIYCCFIDFCKSFDAVLCPWFMQHLEDLGVLVVCNGESMHYRCQEKLSILMGWQTIANMYRVKQGCPSVSPMLSGLYIDEISNYIERLRGSGVSLAWTTIPLLLYVDDIVLISNFPRGTSKNLNALESFCIDKICQSTLKKPLKRDEKIRTGILLGRWKGGVNMTLYI